MIMMIYIQRHSCHSGTSHEFPANCLNDRTICPLMHTTLYCHLQCIKYGGFNDLMSKNCLICPSNCIFVRNFVLVFKISYHEPVMAGESFTIEISIDYP